MVRRIKILPSVLFFSLFIGAVPVMANESLFYKELNLIGGYSQRDGWVDRTDMLSSSAGFEHYGKWANEYGDYLTTDLQMRFAYNTSRAFADASSMEVHNAWAEYRSSDAVKIKAGHFEPAFGLEQVVDVHSTILQTLAMENIGLTRDWGVGLRGALPACDYWVALQTGSGMSIRRTDGSYLATIRVGKPAGGDLQYGVSALVGRVLETMGMSTFPKDHLVSREAVSKKRIGLDVLYTWNAFKVKGETAYGKNDHRNVAGYLVEVAYTPPQAQNWEFETQFQSFINDVGRGRTDDSTTSAGMAYKVNQAVTLRTVLEYDIHRYNEERETRALVQLYYYGQ
ncbi:MAG: hypothetical protein WCG78_03630 [Candidatus Omnitrophota bacterium]